MGEIQISKKPNANYGNSIISNPIVVDISTDIFPFTRAEKIKLESIYDNKSLVSTIVKEVPVGLVNGINDTFVLSNMPININFLDVFINGIKREIISLNYRTFSLGFAPASGSVIETNYYISATIIDPILSQFNLNKLTSFYNAYMLSNDILTDNYDDVITDNEGKLIFTN